MKDGKRNEKLSWLSKVLLFVAFLCIIFSLVAPMALSESNHFYNNLYGDFSNDTVGGLMSPFIAIAGVIVTFLAFFMQVKANKIQTEQFKKSLAKPFIDEKIDCYKYLNVIKADMKCVQEDIETRNDYITEYISGLKETQLQYSALKRTSIHYLEKCVFYDKIKLHRSLDVLFVDKMHVYDFYIQYRSCIDTICPLYNELYAKVKMYSDQKIKKIENWSIIVNDIYLCSFDVINVEDTLKPIYLNKLKSIISVITNNSENCEDNKSDFDYKNVYNIIKDAYSFFDSVDKNPKLDRIYTLLRTYIQSVESVIFDTHQISTLSSLIIDTSNYELKKIESLLNQLDDILNMTSIEKITDEFLNDYAIKQ